MILYKPENIYFIFEYKPKKIYIESLRFNDVERFPMTSLSNILHHFLNTKSREYLDYYWEFYSKHSQREFIKHFSERFK